MATTTTELIPLARHQLEAPRSNSKSLAKALGCPAFFVGQYLQRDVFADNPHYLAKTGTEFHLYRQRYVKHLVATGQSSDKGWRLAYLETEHLSEDVRPLILDDTFAVDPETVFDCEVFLSIDRDFRPLEMDTGRRPGVLSGHPDALLSGTPDLILMLDGGRRVVIRDPKSGFSTVGVTDEEPPIYAALIMAHFPRVQTVDFVWDFVRKDSIKRSRYERKDLDWIHQMVVIEIDAKKYEYVERHNAGEQLPANPLAGLCPYCQVTCPQRPRWDAGELAIGPCQTDEDFHKLVLLKKVCDDISKRAGKVGLAYLDAHGGRKELGSDWEAEACVTQTFEYPLVEALAILGLRVVTLDGNPAPSHSPAFDVPLSSLSVSGLSDAAKRRRSQRRVSREGMRAQLRAIAKESSYTKLIIRKRQQALAELLEASVAQLEG